MELSPVVGSWLAIDRVDFLIERWFDAFRRSRYHSIIMLIVQS
jgi:hypothetical protein